jgi:hypothetical protein
VSSRVKACTTCNRKNFSPYIYPYLPAHRYQRQKGRWSRTKLTWFVWLTRRCNHRKDSACNVHKVKCDVNALSFQRASSISWNCWEWSTLSPNNCTWNAWEPNVRELVANDSKLHCNWRTLPIISSVPFQSKLRSNSGNSCHCNLKQRWSDYPNQVNIFRFHCTYSCFF